MASIAHHLGAEQEAAIDLLHQAEAVTAGLDDYPAQISLLQARVFNGFFQGDIALVRATAADGVRLSRNAGDLYSLEMMLLNSATTAFALGEVQRAKGLYVEALSIAKRIDDRVAQYALLDGLASVAAAMEEGKLAARLLGAAETIRTQAGARLIPVLAPMIAQAEERAVERIGRSTFDAELEAGRRLSRDDAIRLGLGQPAEDRNGSRPVAALPLLGRREADVARLIADGLSNKQIGARLFISERTVDSHVRSILNKLGVNSRAQIAGWITAKAEAEDS
jgi:DNA-binding CsgD family transcriptional regulator